MGTFVREYKVYQKSTYLIIEYFVFFWEEYSDLIYKVSCIGYFCFYSHIKRIIMHNLTLDNLDANLYFSRFSTFSKRNSICIGEEPPSREIFHTLSINEAIGNIYYFSRSIGNLRMIEGDLFNDTLVYGSTLDRNTDKFSDLKGSRKKNR